MVNSLLCENRKYIPNYLMVKKGVTKYVHRTAPYRTDGKSRILPTIFIPNPSIKLMWHFVFEVGRVGRVGEIFAYMYQWDMIYMIRTA